MKAIVADDEPLLAAALKSALADAWPELDVAAVLANGLEAVEAAVRLRPDIAFLDIRMPGLSGLDAAAEIAERLGEDAPAIVFVTAHDEHATRAFELAAADYLLKPVARERLAAAVARLKARPKGLAELARQLRALASPPAASKETLRQLRAGSGTAVKLIPVAEVIYLQAADKYTTVVTAASEDLLRTSLKELLAQLPENFQQVHRGSVVNMDAVAAAARDEAGRVTLRLRGRKDTLAVSRVYADLFKAM